MPASFNRFRVIPRPAMLMLGFVGLSVILSACRINDPLANGVPTVIITVPPPPTDTLAPIISMTPRFTATLIPSRTPMPTQPPPPTLTPTSEISTATLTPTVIPVVRGTVNKNNSVVNLRSGASSDFETLRRINAGTLLTVIGYNDAKSWALIRLDDGTTGWVSAAFLDIPENATLGIVTDTDATQIAALPPPPTPAPTLPARLPSRTDVLAYCDLPGFEKDAGKSLSASANITVYWNWFASTPEQIQDHLDNGVYEVKLNDQVLDNWESYRTTVRRLSASRYEVFWYVPVGKLAAGDYTISYNLTWKAQISDGEATFGPGGEQETNTGSCKFTVS